MTALLDWIVEHPGPSLVIWLGLIFLIAAVRGGLR